MRGRLLILGGRLRGMLAAVLGVVLTAGVVVALGLLADAAQRPDPGPVTLRGEVAVTVLPGDTVWDLAHRVAPRSSGPELAAIAERIVVDNDLTSARPPSGQVLRVRAD